MALSANADFTSHSWHWARQLLLAPLSLKIRGAPADLIPTKKIKQDYLQPGKQTHMLCGFSYLRSFQTSITTTVQRVKVVPCLIFHGSFEGACRSPTSIIHVKWCVQAESISLPPVALPTCCPPAAPSRLPWDACETPLQMLCFASFGVFWGNAQTAHLLFKQLMDSMKHLVSGAL